MKLKRENRSYKIERVYSNVFFCRNNQKALLPAGTDDEVFVFRNENNHIILTYNRRFGYAGLEIYDEALDCISEVFFQDNIEEIHKRFWNLAEINMAKVLLQYCDY